MTTKEYQELVCRTQNKALSIRDSIMQKVMGIAGEAGEVVDIYKKHFFQKHELKIDQIKEELGDLMWYIAGLCNLEDISLNDVYEQNIAKLKRRYPKGFTEKDSKDRKDKKGKTR